MKKRLSAVRENVVLGILFLCVLFGASSAWAAAARTKIIVVVPHRILFTVALPVYIAQEKGFYKENNIDVDAVFTRGGGENVQAVVSGDAQIGLGTGTLAVITAFVKKAPIKIAAAEITGMDAFWYVQSNTSMRKLEDLSGKKVAYSRPGASSHMAVLAIADQVKAKGLKPAEPVSLGGIPEVYTAVRTGQADAGWSVAPFQLDRVEKGELRVVVKGEEIAGDEGDHPASAFSQQRLRGEKSRRRARLFPSPTKGPRLHVREQGGRRENLDQKS